MAVLPLLFAISIRLIQSQIIVDNTYIGTNVACPLGKDCVVECEACNNKIIVCPTEYACTVNIRSGYAATIQATNAGKMEVYCTSCGSLTIDATLSALPDASFKLQCTNDFGTVSNPGCPYLDATIVHVEAAYTAATQSNKYTVEIVCNGPSACKSIYVDTAINGAISAICDDDNTCNRGQIIYNPPANTNGIFNLECLGTKEACYWLKIMSLTARQIHVRCGDGSQALDSRVCYLLQITGPVMPFDRPEYTMDSILTDSVLIECNGNQCARVEVWVPFGAFQVTPIDYVYDWNKGLYINYDKCGWDFPSGGMYIMSSKQQINLTIMYIGWDTPRRDTYACDDKIEIDGIVMWFLREGAGASVIVTNPYIYSFSKSSPNNNVYCPNDGHCIVYSMERTNRLGLKTRVECPTDAKSLCYVFAMQPGGLKDAIITGTSARLLLTKGYDGGSDASNSFEGATVYAPSGNFVSNGIFVVPAGNAANSFANAVFYADTTPQIFIPKTFSGFVGATLYANQSTWTHVECDYHSMCTNLTVYVDNPGLTPPVSTYIPNTFCLECSRYYTQGCVSMDLFIDPQGVLNSNVYQFGSQLLNSGEWYWSAKYGNELIPDSMDTTCNQLSSDLLEGTWYWWYPPPTTSPTPKPTFNPTINPTSLPTITTLNPTTNPVTISPTIDPTSVPTSNPIVPTLTSGPTLNPSADPTERPTTKPPSDPTIATSKNPTMSPSYAPTTSGCDPTSFNITAVVQADNQTIIALQDVIGDIIYYQTEIYLKNISSVYLLDVFCRESVFIIFQNQTNGTTETNIEVTILIAENENNKLEVDKIDDDVYGEILETEIEEQTGTEIEVDVDVELKEGGNPEKLDTSTFLGLDVGVQYLLVGGVLLIIICCICAVTICCLFAIGQDKEKKKNKDHYHTNSTLKNGMQRVPVSSPTMTEHSGETKSFPAIGMVAKTNTDIEMDGVNLQNKQNKNEEKESEMIMSQDTLGMALPELPAATPSIALQPNPNDDNMHDLPNLPKSIPPVMDLAGSGDGAPTGDHIISDDESENSDENMYNKTTNGNDGYAE